MKAIIRSLTFVLLIGTTVKVAILFSIFVAGLLTPALSQASDLRFETPNLIVIDNTRNLSDERLRQLANHAQETLNKVLTFWSADSEIGQFGKIRVIFDTPRRRPYYVSVFYWDKENGRRVRVVRVFGSERLPQEMAHKLTTAVLPHEDKLIRNIMGVPTEEQLGNPLTFPGCGFSSDDWVLAFLRTNSLIPLNELGPDGESWGHPIGADGLPYVSDRAKQSKGYAEAGSFGNYLILTYGINKIKQFYRLSFQKERPWRDIFGVGIQELEANWLKTLQVDEKTRGENASTLSKLFERNPNTACLEAEKLVIRKTDGTTAR
ncbi:MAG: hypothetical protein ACE144_06395 [Thermodesulfobacteriota bacterium]